MKKLCNFFACTIFFLSSAKIFPQAQIQLLASKNPVFAQYQQEVEDSNKAFAQKGQVELNYYQYTAGKNDSVYSVASRCSITYDSLVTLNRLESKDAVLEGKKLFLPTLNGIFIAQNPLSPLEILLSKEYADLINKENCIMINVDKNKFYFLAGMRFTPADRAFFLDTSMRLPLEESVLTSAYGMRTSPISGKWKMHNGIDMAAPLGTSVLACKNAQVLSVVKNDYTYGNYIILKHDNTTTSLYAHLSKIDVKEGDIVKTGQKIAQVGTSGLSTGPHLHFEIRKKGRAQNPSLYVK